EGREWGQGGGWGVELPPFQGPRKPARRGTGRQLELGRLRRLLGAALGRAASRAAGEGGAAVVPSADDAPGEGSARAGLGRPAAAAGPAGIRLGTALIL